jgi:undecaprenyl-diphosphatase
MSTIQSILLGIIQGATEFLPVSSSGHLVVARAVMGIAEIPILFDILLHIPTLLAIVLVFRRRLARILASLVRYMRKAGREEDRENLRLFAAICVATLATGVVGFALSILQDLFTFETQWVGVLFLCTALILIVSTRFTGEKDYGELGVREGLITGIAQGIGVLPGISRSGITISASLAAGMRRERAGEFAFLVSIPAILGALGLKIRDLEFLPIPALTILAGMASSFVVGYISLLLLLRLIKSGKLYLFCFYLIPIGVLTIVFL